jgi:hypothetical protein
MKKITTIAILIAAVLSASAQGEWKWANYWTGNDDPLNSYNPYNYVVRTAFDDDGNVYVYGCFGGNARVYDQNTSDWLCDDVAVILANTKGCALMKFDSSGNLLWNRTIKKSQQGDCQPYDMVLHDGRILISGQYDFTSGTSETLWFLDTLITQQTGFSYPVGEYHPPYTFTDGFNSFFSILDIDGNVLENHFAKVLSRSADNRFFLPITTGWECSMCIDRYGNLYLATGISYSGPDTLPWTVVIDEDTSKTYDLYLPGSSSEYSGIINMMLFKISSNFELVGTKLLVDHTDGVSSYIPVDSVNPYYVPYVLGLSIDNEDNLYLSGYLRDMYLMNEYNEYPMRFYWDSTHYATADDPSTGKFLPYIVKYDSDGNVLWSNQVSVSNDPSTDFYHFAVWGDNCVAGDGVYLMGQANTSIGHNPLFYFDDPSNCLSLIPDSNQHTSFFVKFDKETGAFKSLGQTPGLHTFVKDESKPAIINNHLLGQFLYDFSIGTLLNYFNTNGSFMGADTISYSHDPNLKTNRTIVNEEGKILCDMTCSQDLTFGHDFTLSFDDHTRSHAVVAYRYDPSILVPYSDDSTGVAGYEELNTPIKLYPNPATNTLFLENEYSPIESFLLLDMAGKEIFHQDLSSHRCEVDVSSIPDGMYFIRTFCEKGSYINKFVKTKN